MDDQITGETMYVICSLDKYKEKGSEGTSTGNHPFIFHSFALLMNGRGLIAVAIVRNALKLAKCKIVTWDWLEDSMQASKEKGRLLSIKDYQLSKVLRGCLDRKKTKDNKNEGFEEHSNGNSLGGLADKSKS